METRIIWISPNAGKNPDERLILDALARSQITALTVPLDRLEEFLFAGGDAVVFNGFGAKGPDARCMDLVRGRVFLRDSGPPPEGATVLDDREGPELTRARILAAMPERYPAPRAGDFSPPWRLRLIGQSAATRKVAEVIRLVGPRRCTVLITGETGTGKEVVARAIHEAGPRSSGPFVALNCSAVPASLLEAELFGHAKGAFTGALQARVGRFEMAQSGTLFLDEIGDLPVELQSKILRVLQEREIQKLGSSETVRVDARIIAATNQDLHLKLRLGTFREDLFYRLNVVPLYVSPLRERMEDLDLLVEHFLAKTCADEGIASKRILPQALPALKNYDWPGNIRQLENAIASAVILSGDRSDLEAADFPDLSARRGPASTDSLGLLKVPDYGIDFTETVNAVERDLLTQALQKTRGNKKAAAEMLRLKRTTLSAKVRVLEIKRSAA